MDREIKFRIIRDNKIIGYERIGDNGWEWMCLELNPDKGERWCSGVFPKSKEYKRVQFIGQEDPNGKEIYEGDIIYKDKDGRAWFVCYGYFGDSKYYVCNGINSGREIRKDITKYDTCFASRTQKEEFELNVIGNIYENPELLK